MASALDAVVKDDAAPHRMNLDLSPKPERRSVGEQDYAFLHLL
jgi:hypothetical protein